MKKAKIKLINYKWVHVLDNGVKNMRNKYAKWKSEDCNQLPPVWDKFLCTCYNPDYGSNPIDHRTYWIKIRNSELTSCPEIPNS